MQYLVTGEFVDPGPLLPPDQFVGVIRQAVLPSHDVVKNLMSEGKILAGGIPSARGVLGLSSRQSPMRS